MLKKIIDDTKPKMNKAIENFSQDLKAVRASRASAELVENIKVAYYGTSTPLKQMASVVIPDASNLLISPWDRNALGDIENALRACEINMTITNDGHAIRLTLPPMSQERRQELIKLVNQKAEALRIGLRNLREEAWKTIQRLEKSGQLTEDDRYQGEEELNKLIKDNDKKIEEILAAKCRQIEG